MTASSAPGCSKQVAAGSKPDDDCLRRAAGHILHDMSLLKDAWANREQRIAYTLWFILMRTLWDFFFEERKQGKDDMVAADYADTWRAVGPKLKQQSPDTKNTWRAATNKLAAHLTFSRVDFEQADHTPSPEMHSYMLGVYTAWLAQLSARASGLVRCRVS